MNLVIKIRGTNKVEKYYKWITVKTLKQHMFLYSFFSTVSVHKFHNILEIYIIISKLFMFFLFCKNNCVPFAGIGFINSMALMFIHRRCCGYFHFFCISFCQDLKYLSVYKAPSCNLEPVGCWEQFRCYTWSW